jgi:hypothetical protein
LKWEAWRVFLRKKSTGLLPSPSASDLASRKWKCLTASFKIKTDGKNASCIEGERQTTRSAVGEPRGLAKEYQADVKRSYVTSRGASCKWEILQSWKTLGPVRLGKAVARQQIANNATAPSTIHKEAAPSTAIDESKIRAPTSVQTKDNRFIDARARSMILMLADIQFAQDANWLVSIDPMRRSMNTALPRAYNFIWLKASSCLGFEKHGRNQLWIW